jgi:hypothetical protein
LFFRIFNTKKTFPAQKKEPSAFIEPGYRWASPIKLKKQGRPLFC